MAAIHVSSGADLLLERFANLNGLPASKRITADARYVKIREKTATARRAALIGRAAAAIPARLMPLVRPPAVVREQSSKPAPTFAVDALDTLMSQRIRVKKGESLFYVGDPLSYLYAVRVGSFKTTLISPDGRSQVTGFLMSGDILGMDAIGMERHACSAVALEDSEVCPIAFNLLERLTVEFPALQHHLNRMLSLEIMRGQAMLLMVGCHNADERLASFLVVLSDSFVSRGYSARCFLLRMSREDMASYLGLRLETVCRSMARFRDMGLIAYQGREMEILDLEALHGQVQCARKNALL